MNPQAFQEKYLPLMPRLYRMAYAILGNAPDAEDAVQEVYLRLWEQAERVERMEKPEQYFVVALRHICITMLRERHEEVELEDVQTELPAAEELSTPRPADLLHSALASLAPKVRRIVMLRHVGNCSIDRIAELTGETEVNIRAILSRTRRRLRDDLKRNSVVLTSTLFTLSTTIPQ